MAGLRIAIRADASAAIGTGHVRRCMSLAHALARCGADVRFVVHPLDGTSAPLIRAQSFRCEWLDPASRPGDTAAAIQAMAAFGPQVVVVDHYGVDAAWHDALRRRFSCLVAAIDELADRPLAPDILIDPNFHPDPVAKYRDVLREGAAMLAGPRYALLGAAYEQAPTYEFSEAVRSIGIFMGGTDPLDACSAALRGCREVAGFSGEIEVVSSRLSPHYGNLQALCARWPATSLEADLPDLATFFARHDLQVGAGGGATWERCRAGVPTVAVLVADNQLSTLPHLDALGVLVWARSGGDLRQSVGESVVALLHDAGQRRELGQRSARMVDGLGAARVAAVITCAADRAFQVRPAAAADEALLLDWANDAVVRANAFQPEPITRPRHAQWFRARMADPAGCRIFIAQAANGVAAGQVRFDWRGDHWECGYSMDAAFRGLGLARLLLGQAMDELWRASGPAGVAGRVKPGNEASARVFRALGFSERATSDERGDFALFFLGAPKT